MYVHATHGVEEESMEFKGDNGVRTRVFDGFQGGSRRFIGVERYSSVIMVVLFKWCSRMFVDAGYQFR
jgi:hypothetical protein